jgi:hypothetical protein
MKKIENDKPAGTKTFKVTLPTGIKLALNVLAAMKQVTHSAYIGGLIDLADRYLKVYGRHISDDPFLNPAPPIAQILQGIDLEALVEEIQIPMERLESLAAGDRPTDSDLSFLVAADCCATYSLEQLFASRKLQFDRPTDRHEVKNNAN